MARRAARLGWLLVTLGFAGPSPAQHLPPPAASGQMPPLLYVKLTGPKGMQATFFRGAAQGQTFVAPCAIGLRPGYLVRLAITGIPEYPNTAFFPTLEVCGSLVPANNLQMPRPIFQPPWYSGRDDFARVRADTANLKKVVVLERPDTALPVATTPDEPFEIAVPPHRNLLWEAYERGQPVLILHME